MSDSPSAVSNPPEQPDANRPAASVVGELIARLEAANGPDRGLFMEAFAVCFPCDDEWEPEDRTARRLRFHRFVDVGAWLDAALTLVPERWRVVDLYQHDDGLTWNAGVRIPGWEVGTDCPAMGPALALCIAALKARLTPPNGSGPETTST